MPQVITPFYIQFHLPSFHLEISESHTMENEERTIHLEVLDKMELEAIGRRMSRFRSIVNFQGNCEVIENHIGLIDPDGTKWVIGGTSVAADFNKCYVSLTH